MIFCARSCTPGKPEATRDSAFTATYARILTIGQTAGIVIFGRFSGRAVGLGPERIFSNQILSSNMQSIKIFSFLLVAGLILAGCKKTTAPEGQAGTDNAVTADAASAAAEQANVAPPHSADAVNQAVQACERMSAFINESIMTKEYELSKATGDALLTEQVAKLKEFQVGFSQMKDKISMSTPETWPALYTEYQQLGVSAKTYMKAMMNQGVN